MTLGPLRHLHVLYLFAGAVRRADIATCLRSLALELNRSQSFGFSVEVHCDEIDTLRGGEDHDLSDKVRQ